MTTILIIEDEEPLREAVVDTLEFEGYDTLQARNGLEGLDLARRRLPDMIICDVLMPEMDGPGVLEALQADPTTADIPFVFLTAITDGDQVRQALDQGAVGYITKPFKQADLIDTIRRHV